MEDLDEDKNGTKPLLEDENSGNCSDIKLERISAATEQKIEGGKKASSIQTIFSIWNTMICRNNSNSSNRFIIWIYLLLYV